MAVFRWRHFAGEIILWAVRWYCRYGISYRELEEMMGERDVIVDHTTVYRWTQRYAPELEKRSAWYRSRLSFSWRVERPMCGSRAAGSTSTGRSTKMARRSISTSPTGATPRPPSASFLPP